MSMAYWSSFGTYGVWSWGIYPMNWIKNKMQDEGGLLVLILAVVGVVAIVVWAIHH
jgi:hypothetical protein